MAQTLEDRLRGGIRRFLPGWFMLLVLAQAGAAAQEAASSPQSPRATVKLTAQQQVILDNARRILQKTLLSDAERQVRLNAVEAIMTGTVGVPDDDNPEVRNPNLWTISNGSYVVAPDHTAAEAIADLWIVHDGDGMPVPRIWCYKYSSLVLAKAYVQYFQDRKDQAGLRAFNNLIGHKVFPDELPNEGEGLLWQRRQGRANLLPGDQVWFENPHFDRGRALLYQTAYQEARRDGKAAEEAKAIAEKAADSAAAGEEGSNVFYLGNDMLSRGALSVVRVFQGNISAPGPAAAPDFDQIYTQKIFTIPRYRQHVIDDFFTVQACLKANHGDVHLDDFQIKRVRYLLDPSSLPQRINSARPNRPAAAGADPDHGTQPIANQASLPASVNDAAVPHDPQPLSVRRLDSLIDAMASRNSPPKLIECAGGRTALFRPDYDWSEQSRVRTAMLAVLETQADAMWWRLLEHARDDRYVLTAAWKGAAENVSVGSFCRDFAIADLSAPYQRHLPTVPGRLPADFRPEDVFWRNEKEYARSGKPLYQIQIELCQRAIEQWAAVKGTVAGAEGRSHTYTADEKARFLAAVKGEIVELKRRKKAVFIDATLPGVAAPSGWEGFDAESEWSARAKCDTSGR